MSPPLPTRVCGPCGKRYGKRPERAICHTVSKGTCGVCGAETWTAPEYDYGYLREGWERERAAETGEASE